MIRLPYKILLTRTILLVTVLTLSLTFSVNKALAASAWINPQTGRITGNTNGSTWSPQFRVSIMVTSYDSEPEMAGATIKLTHSSNVKVVSIEDGDFDTYIKKDFDADNNTIEIQAVNQSGTYKTGDVRLASITFEPLSNTGDVQLTIEQDSVISGAGGEQLLTETIKGVYTLDIQDPNNTTTGGEGSETQPTKETTTGAEIETGITDSLSIYLLISIGLIATGLVLGGTFNDKKKLTS